MYWCLRTTWWEGSFQESPNYSYGLKCLSQSHECWGKSRVTEAGSTEQLTSPEPSVCIYKECSNLEAVIPFCCCLASSSKSSVLLVTFRFIYSYSHYTQHFLAPNDQCSSLSQHVPLYPMELFFIVLFCF